MSEELKYKGRTAEELFDLMDKESNVNSGVVKKVGTKYIELIETIYGLDTSDIKKDWLLDLVKITYVAEAESLAALTGYQGVMKELRKEISLCMICGEDEQRV